MKFDLEKLPKYCPLCSKSGTSSKVKLYGMNDGFVIMCKNSKCPWPFSEYSKEEVKFTKEEAEVHEQRKAALKNKNSGKRKTHSSSPDKEKTKKQKTKETGEASVLIESQNQSHNASLPSQTAKRKLNSDDGNAKSNKVGNFMPLKSELKASVLTELILPGDLEAAGAKDPLLPSPVKDPLIAHKGNGLEKSLEQPALTEAEIFKAIPVSIRKPLRLPKHAVQILDSRVDNDDKDAAACSSQSSFGDDDQNDLSEFDIEGSDSELESLVSECSTMTQVSGFSAGEEGKGLGKIKRRGKRIKKKRKDRRKNHSQKCSKHKERHTDISAVFVSGTPEKDKSSLTTEDQTEHATFEHFDTNDASANEPAVEVDPYDYGSVAAGDVHQQQEQAEEEVILSEFMPVVNHQPSVAAHNGVVAKHDHSIVIESKVCDDIMRGRGEARQVKQEVTSEHRVVDQCYALAETQIIIHREDDLSLYYADDGVDFVGSGDIGIGFTFEDPRTEILVNCPPVKIRKDNLDDLIIVLSREANAFKLKSVKYKIPKVTKEVTRAKSRLEKCVLEHIRTCFTFKWIDKHRKENDSFNSRIQESDESQMEIIRESQSDVENCILEVVSTSPETETFKKPDAPTKSQSFSIAGNNLASPSKQGRVNEVHGNQPPRELCYNLMLEPLSPMPPTPKSYDPMVLDPATPSNKSVSGASTSSLADKDDCILPDIDSAYDGDDDVVGGDDHVDLVNYTTDGTGEVESMDQTDEHTTASEQVEQKADEKENCRVQESPQHNTHEDIDIKMNLVDNMQTSEKRGKHSSAMLKDIPIRSLPSLSNRLIFKTGIKGISIQTINVCTMEQPINPVRHSPVDNMYEGTIANLVNKKCEDVELHKVWKMGAGSSTPPCEEIQPDKPLLPASDNGGAAMSNTVFHVAHTTCIDLPQQMNTLEITERGHNKALLTRESDQVEVNALKTSGSPINSGRKRYNKKNQHGDGWFMWKTMRVDAESCESYSDYIREVQTKWDMDPLKALAKEKGINSHKDVQVAINFYTHILSKIQYLQLEYNLQVEDAIDFTRTNYHKKDEEFYFLCGEVFHGSVIVPEDVVLEDVLSQDTIRKLDNPTLPASGLDLTQPLSHDLIEKMKRMKCVKTDFPEDLSLKQEKSYDMCQSITDVHIIDPESIQSSDRENIVGVGNICIQFFYADPVSGRKVPFKPIRVRDEEDIKAVVALSNERAEDFNYKCGYIDKPMKFYSEVVRAKTRLLPDIVKYIKTCFTHRGMKINRIDYVKKEQTRVKPQLMSKVDIKNLVGSMSDNDTDDALNESSDDCGIVESDNEDLRWVASVPVRQNKRAVVRKKPRKPVDDSDRVLEARVFGSALPHLKQDEKVFTKNRKAAFNTWEAGKKEDEILSQKTSAHQILESSSGRRGKRTKQNEGLKLASLVKSSRRRQRKVETDSSSSDDIDEDDLNPDNIYFNKESGQTRKSDRIKTKFGNYVYDEQTSYDVKASVQTNNQETKQKPLNPSPVRHVSFTNKETEISNDRPITESKIIKEGRENNAAEVSTSQHDKEENKNTSRPSSRACSRSSNVASPVIERALSALSNRPSSQSSDLPDSRPDSKIERPKSVMLHRSKIEYGVRSVCLEDPEEDSPVLAPRRRQEALKEKEQQQQHNHRPSIAGEMPRAEPDNQVNTTTYAAVNTTTATGETKSTPVNLQKFDQYNVRKSKKVKKILEKQKKRAEKNEKKKLRGFGQKPEDLPPPPKESVQAKERKEAKQASIKKAQVSKEESELMMSLLMDAEMAVSRHKELESSAKEAEMSQTSVLGTTSATEISQFEEYQNIMEIQDPIDDDFLSKL